jgi:hypothetical protein
MTFYEALEHLKRGEKIGRDGRVFQLGRGVFDVTLAEPDRVAFDDLDRESDDWSVISHAAEEPGG